MERTLDYADQAAFVADQRVHQHRFRFLQVRHLENGKVSAEVPKIRRNR
jgi:hypothetical protein